MRVRASALVAVGVAVLAVVAPPVSGQGLRVEAAVVYATLGGDDFEGTKAGIGFEGALVLRVSPRLSLAAGLTRTTHDEEDESVKSTVLQIFAEPRFMLSSSSSAVMPYVFGRVGWLKGSGEVEGLDLDLKATGFAFGGGLGMLYTVSGSVAVNVAGGFHKVSFGDVEVDGEAESNTDVSGTSMLIRGGISIGFGGSSAMKTLPRRPVAR